VQQGLCFIRILRCLWRLRTYNVYWRVCSACDHGVPHHRPRIFFVLILSSVDSGFQFPGPLPPVGLDSFLDERRFRPKWSDLPPDGTVAHRNVLAVLFRLCESGHNPFEDTWVINCDNSEGREHAMLNRSPCITRSRARGHWLTSRGRRMSTRELWRLFGLKDRDFLSNVPPLTLGQQLGNSMSVNVLERIFCNLLPAAGLRSRHEMLDRYA
jgi:site-specific DNA-cytosine methylase